MVAGIRVTSRELSRSFCGAAAVLAVASAAGCAPPQQDGEQARLGTVRYAIADGYDDTEDVAVVAITQPAAGKLCSGTLIAPNVILTAGHCVAPTFGDEAGVLCDKTTLGNSDQPKSFFVSTFPVVEVANAGEFFVDEVVRVPTDDTLFCGNDAAILILSDSVPAAKTLPWQPAVDAPLVSGQVYSAIGFGGTNNGGEGSGTRRRRDDIVLDCVGAACEDSQVVEQEWLGGAGICRGDSGGPSINADGEVIGIASRGSNACDASLYIGTYQWRDWLKDTVVYASGIGVYDAPDWTAGSNVNPEHSMPIGETCSAPAECPSDRCLQDGEESYCTRICDEQHVCPEDYSCGESNGQQLCFYTPPEPPPPFKRVEVENCSVSNAGKRGGNGWWLMLALPLIVWRRFRFSE